MTTKAYTTILILAINLIVASTLFAQKKTRQVNMIYSIPSFTDDHFLGKILPILVEKKVIGAISESKSEIEIREHIFVPSPVPSSTTIIKYDHGIIKKYEYNMLLRQTNANFRKEVFVDLGTLSGYNDDMHLFVQTEPEKAIPVGEFQKLFNELFDVNFCGLLNHEMLTNKILQLHPDTKVSNFSPYNYFEVKVKGHYKLIYYGTEYTPEPLDLKEYLQVKQTLNLLNKIKNL